MLGVMESLEDEACRCRNQYESHGKNSCQSAASSILQVPGVQTQQGDTNTAHEQDDPGHNRCEESEDLLHLFSPVFLRDCNSIE